LKIELERDSTVIDSQEREFDTSNNLINNGLKMYIEIGPCHSMIT